MSNETQYSAPSNQCLQHAVKIAIVEDRPIMMDYWTSSVDKSVLIGVKEDGEKCWQAPCFHQRVIVHFIRGKLEMTSEGCQVLFAQILLYKMEYKWPQIICFYFHLFNIY